MGSRERLSLVDRTESNSVKSSPMPYGTGGAHFGKASCLFPPTAPERCRRFLAGDFRLLVSCARASTVKERAAIL